MGQQNNYTILEGFDKIQAVLGKYGKSIDDCDQLDYNGAYVMHLSDGKVLLFSNDGRVGIFFEDTSTYQQMLAKEYFPVPDPPSIFYQVRDLTTPLNFSIYPFLEKLTKFEISEIPDGSQVEESIRRLSKKINEIGKKNITAEEFIAIGIFFQEILRTEYQGSWNVDKVYTSLNPYYIPTVSFTDFAILLWQRLDKHWQTGKNVSLDKLYFEIKREISFLK